MTYQDVDLHNVAELVDEPGVDGLRMQRVPESTRIRLEERAQAAVQHPGSCEIRFVVEGERAQITLSAKTPGTTVTLFYGPFHSRQEWTLSEEPLTITVSRPKYEALLAPVAADAIVDSGFSPRVCRLVFWWRGIAMLHDISGAVRPPHDNELPDRTLLAYGTSITYGAAATQSYLTWVSQVGRRLGLDTVNLGVGGACRCEPAFGEYIASRNDWDIAVLSLSVNMIGSGFSIEQFTGRVRYLVDSIATAHPGKPIVCVSIYPYYGDWAPELQTGARAKPMEFRNALQRVVEELEHGNLHFVDGRSILTDVSSLSADLIHPSDLGMITMGENMATTLGGLL